MKAYAYGATFYEDTHKCKLILNIQGREERVDYITGNFDRYDFRVPGDYRIILKDIRVRTKYSTREILIMRDAFIDAMKAQDLIGKLWPDQIVSFKCDDIKFLEVINPYEIKY